MLISEVSELVGLSAKTIRYYESEGVIPTADRQANGYRTYGEADVRLLRMVAAARALDLPLEDIRDLGQLVSAGRQPCARLHSMAEQRRSMVRRMIQELHTVEERLTDAIALTSDASNTASIQTHSGCPPRSRRNESDLARQDRPWPTGHDTSSILGTGAGTA